VPHDTFHHSCVADLSFLRIRLHFGFIRLCAFYSLQILFHRFYKDAGLLWPGELVSGVQRSTGDEMMFFTLKKKVCWVDNKVSAKPVFKNGLLSMITRPSRRCMCPWEAEQGIWRERVGLLEGLNDLPVDAGGKGRYCGEHLVISDAQVTGMAARKSLLS
jgi:hypothetical protein